MIQCGGKIYLKLERGGKPIPGRRVGEKETAPTIMGEWGKCRKRSLRRRTQKEKMLLSSSENFLAASEEGQRDASRGRKDI